MFRSFRIRDRRRAILADDNQYPAPSWSWAVGALIEWPLWVARKDLEDLAFLLCDSVKPLETDSFGQLKSSSLDLRCFLICIPPKPLDYNLNPRQYEIRPCRIFLVFAQMEQAPGQSSVNRCSANLPSSNLHICCRQPSTSWQLLRNYRAARAPGSYRSGSVRGRITCESWISKHQRTWNRRSF